MSRRELNQVMKMAESKSVRRRKAIMVGKSSKMVDPDDMMKMMGVTDKKNKKSFRVNKRKK